MWNRGALAAEAVGCANHLADAVFADRRFLRSAVGHEICEKLEVARPAKDGGGLDRADAPAERRRKRNRLAKHFSVHGGVGHHALLAQAARPSLKLRLDQRDHAPACAQHGEGGRQNQPDGDERHVHDSQRRRQLKHLRPQRAGVRLLHAHHARVGAQFRGELVRADVDGVDEPGPRAQQHVRKSAGRGTDVHADLPGGRNAERLQRTRQLESAAADVGQVASGHFEPVGFRNPRRAARDLPAVLHRQPCGDQRLRALAARRETSPDQRHIGAKTVRFLHWATLHFAVWVGEGNW